MSKLYEAIDTEGLPRQIRFYDNGVGTSSNKYLKGITGAFGFGLRKNVLDLYEFLARHWQPGDQIYIFGFSRGAATVRGFAGMLQECGLLWIDGDHPDCKCFDEDRFQALLDLAMDAYRTRRDPGVNPAASKAFQDSVAASAGGFHLEPRVPVRMIGVWDTVSALGFPTGWHGWLDPIFKGLERVADRWFPHSFYNYRLDDRVGHACHALAIDDERRTFHPMVWNEIDEPRPQHLEQVWFVGMHSNIGGGYPRTGLASVTLDWMLAHAAIQELRFQPDAVSAARSSANSQGKMHDSRDGFGVYYRYAPRDLVDLCERATLKKGEVKVHRSAVDRIHAGTARYAPGLLPQAFKRVDTPSPAAQGTPGAAPHIPAPQVIKMDADAWRRHRREVLKWIDRRSLLYRTFVYVSVVLAAWMVGLWLGSGDEPPGEPPQSLLEHVGWGSLDALLDQAARVTGWVFGQLAVLLEWALPKATEALMRLFVIETPILAVALVGVALTLFGLRSRFFLKSAAAAQAARAVLLRAKAAADGHQVVETPVEGETRTPPVRARTVVVRLAALAVWLVLAVGAWRLSFPAVAAADDVVGKILVMLGLPTVVFFPFAALMRALSGRVPPADALNLRWTGYTVEQAEEYWGRIRDDPSAEQHLLRLDLIFPLFYGGAFATSLLIGAAHIGSPFGTWVIVPVVVAVLADWVENLVQLRQLGRFTGNNRQGLQKSWIRVASGATIVKLWAVGVSAGLIAALAGWVALAALLQA